jgi:hypothetical protein
VYDIALNGIPLRPNVPAPYREAWAKAVSTVAERLWGIWEEASEAVTRALKWHLILPSPVTALGMYAGFKQ